MARSCASTGRSRIEIASAIWPRPSDAPYASGGSGACHAGAQGAVFSAPRVPARTGCGKSSHAIHAWSRRRETASSARLRSAQGTNPAAVYPSPGLATDRSAPAHTASGAAPTSGRAGPRLRLDTRSVPKEGAPQRRSAIWRIEQPAAKPREISSRSASLSVRGAVFAPASQSQRRAPAASKRNRIVDLTRGRYPGSNIRPSTAAKSRFSPQANMPPISSYTTPPQSITVDGVASTS